MMDKWYLLRVGRFFEEEGSLKLFGGLSDQREKSFFQIQKEISKALAHGYKKIVFPWNFIYHSEEAKLFSLLLDKSDIFIPSVHKKSLSDFKKLFEKNRSSQKAWNQFGNEGEYYKNKEAFEKIENDEDKTKQEWASSQKNPKDYFTLNYLVDEEPFSEIDLSHCVITLLGYRKTNLKKMSHCIKNNHPDAKTFVDFPCSHKKHPDLYNPEEIYAFLKEDFYPPTPVDTYNLSIPTDLKLEPDPEFSLEPSLKPKMVFSVKSKKYEKTQERNREKERVIESLSKSYTKRASVIIPFYEDFKELILTLKHLHKQDLNKDQFEVLVVDDGSPTEIDLKNLEFLKDMNFQLIKNPRSLARTGSKDHRFRAGIARNLGAYLSQGEFLFFLDADILTPPSYLSSGLEKLEKHPVIQHPRYHLKASAPVEYQKIIKENDCFVRKVPYWETFYQEAQNWNEKKLPWKYISTNTLCLSSKLFQQVGAFRKNYTCYGFEDTDLGFRLYQQGIPLHLNFLPTYHLWRASEYFGEEELKQELLGLSVLTFFHNTHSLSAYREFYHLIKKSLF